MTGQMIKRGENKWLLRVYKGRDPQTRTRLYRSVTFKGDRVQAREALDRMLLAQKQGKEYGQRDMTMGEHLNRWLENYASNHYAHKTFENYKGILNFDVRPTIGHIKLTQLKPEDVQRVLNVMKVRGVCSNTRRRLYSVLSTLLDSAVEWGLIEQNPAAQVQIPRREKREMRALSREEVRKFLTVTDRGRWAEYFRTSIITGMRPGEMGALRWDDIDFEHHIISVQRSLIWRGYNPSQGWMLGQPKTERGRRQITIPKSLTSRLTDLRKKQQEVKCKAGATYEDQGFVFANRWGRPIFHRQFVRQVFKIALVRAGLPKSIRLYDLRHTCATLLLKAGEHIKVVSERLGHASVSTTLETYIHVLPGMQEGAATKMESLLSDSDGTPKAHESAHRDDEDEH